MKKTFLLLLIISTILFSCNRVKEKAKFPRLNNPEFIKSNLLSEKFRDYDLYARMEYYKVPGVNISIVKGEKIVWNQGYGLTEVKTDKKVDSNTLFQAGSVSKPIAAPGILKLVDQNIIGLVPSVKSNSLAP